MSDQRGMRFHAGRCSECGLPIPLQKLWCEEHRKTGPRGFARHKDGTRTALDSYEELEANHGRKLDIYIARGQA